MFWEEKVYIRKLIFLLHDMCITLIYHEFSNLCPSWIIFYFISKKVPVGSFHSVFLYITFHIIQHIRMKSSWTFPTIATLAIIHTQKIFFKYFTKSSRTFSPPKKTFKKHHVLINFFFTQSCKSLRTLATTHKQTHRKVRELFTPTTTIFFYKKDMFYDKKYSPVKSSRTFLPATMDHELFVFSWKFHILHNIYVRVARVATLAKSLQTLHERHVMLWKKTSPEHVFFWKTFFKIQTPLIHKKKVMKHVFFCSFFWCRGWTFS